MSYTISARQHGGARRARIHAAAVVTRASAFYAAILCCHFPCHVCFIACFASASCARSPRHFSAVSFSSPAPARHAPAAPRFSFCARFHRHHARARHFAARRRHAQRSGAARARAAPARHGGICRITPCCRRRCFHVMPFYLPLFTALNAHAPRLPHYCLSFVVLPKCAQTWNEWNGPAGRFKRRINK